MIRVTSTRSSKRVLVAVTREMYRHRNAIRESFYLVGQIVGNRVGKLITEGPKTGRIYRFRGMDHQASAPGEPPATRSGRLIKSFNYNVHGYRQMELGESAPYAGYLEEGTRNMQPRPHVIRAINETQGDVVNIFYAQYERAKA